MVHIHCAYTEAINPSGSDPVLSRDQVGALVSPILWQKTYSPLSILALTE